MKKDENTRLPTSGDIFTTQKKKRKSYVNFRTVWKPIKKVFNFENKIKRPKKKTRKN